MRGLFFYLNLDFFLLQEFWIFIASYSASATLVIHSKKSDHCILLLIVLRFYVWQRVSLMMFYTEEFQLCNYYFSFSLFFLPIHSLIFQFPFILLLIFLVILLLFDIFYPLPSLHFLSILTSSFIFLIFLSPSVICLCHVAPSYLII